MDFLDYLQSTRASIDNKLASLIPSEDTPYKILFDAAKYSLLSPGKRLRPALTLAVSKMLGVSEDQAITPACALEFIHTYSMIHDDLPAMDNDDFRRGSPSLHKAYPEAIAILAGDFLLTHAFYLLSESKGLDAEQKIALISTLSLSAGIDGMISGQIMDVQAEGREIDFETLQMIHEKKTGSLIATSVEFGAILAKSDEKTRAILKSYGQKIGFAFQIMDDLLDGDLEASDAANQKPTFLSMMGAKKAKILAENLVEESKKILELLPYDCSILRSLADYVIQRNH